MSLRHPFRIIRSHLRAYLVINLAAYGLVILGMVIGLVFPDLNAARSAALEDDGTGALVRDLVSTPPLFALAILAVNIVRLGALTIILPSLVVPFSGLALFAFWALQTGITLAPASAEAAVALIPHSLTIIIEIQAYVVLALGAFLIGRYWIDPRTVDASRRRAAYARGLQHIGVLALPALALLLIGALWEAYSLRYLVHPLTELLL